MQKVEITKPNTVMEVIARDRVAGDPRWSVLIPAYNCGDYLSVCLKSVLDQALAPEEMEIIVSDDASLEGSPEDLVRELGGGRVRFVRQEKNLGHTGNFEFLLNEARGSLTHLLHADDYVLPGFYDAQDRVYRENPEVMACFCANLHVDEKGREQSRSAWKAEKGIQGREWLLAMCVHNQLQTASMTVKREVYERLGGFDSRFGWTEDWEMWARIGSQYPVYFIPDPFCAYRRVKDSNTSKRFRTGQNVRDVYETGLQVQSYVADVPEAVCRKHRRYCMSIASSIIRLLPRHDFSGIWRNAFEALKIDFVFAGPRMVKAWFARRSST